MVPEVVDVIVEAELVHRHIIRKEVVEVAFSWKKVKKRAVRHMKDRLKLYLANGRNQEARRLKEKIERLEKDV